MQLLKLQNQYNTEDFFVHKQNCDQHPHFIRIAGSLCVSTITEKEAEARPEIYLRYVIGLQTCRPNPFALREFQ